MKTFEYYCCWLDVFNSTAVQEFLDLKGASGWEVIQVIPGKGDAEYSCLFIMKKTIE